MPPSPTKTTAMAATGLLATPAKIVNTNNLVDDESGSDSDSSSTRGQEDTTKKDTTKIWNKSKSKPNTKKDDKKKGTVKKRCTWTHEQDEWLVEKWPEWHSLKSAHPRASFESEVFQEFQEQFPDVTPETRPALEKEIAHWLHNGRAKVNKLRPDLLPDGDGTARIGQRSKAVFGEMRTPRQQSASKLWGSDHCELIKEAMRSAGLPLSGPSFIGDFTKYRKELWEDLPEKEQRKWNRKAAVADTESAGTASSLAFTRAERLDQINYALTTLIGDGAGQIGSETVFLLMSAYVNNSGAIEVHVGDYGKKDGAGRGFERWFERAHTTLSQSDNAGGKKKLSWLTGKFTEFAEEVLDTQQNIDKLPRLPKYTRDINAGEALMDYLKALYKYAGFKDRLQDDKIDDMVDPYWAEKFTDLLHMEEHEAIALYMDVFKASGTERELKFKGNEATSSNITPAENPTVTSTPSQSVLPNRSATTPSKSTPPNRSAATPSDSPTIGKSTPSNSPTTSPSKSKSTLSGCLATTPNNPTTSPSKSMPSSEPEGPAEQHGQSEADAMDHCGNDISDTEEEPPQKQRAPAAPKKSVPKTSVRGKKRAREEEEETLQERKRKTKKVVLAVPKIVEEPTGRAKRMKKPTEKRLEAERNAAKRDKRGPRK